MNASHCASGGNRRPRVTVGSDCQMEGGNPKHLLSRDH